jgi:hypothetical protein
VDLYQNCRMLDYRKSSAGYTVIKLTDKPSNVSSCKSRPRSKTAPFHWLSMGLIVIKYQ